MATQPQPNRASMCRAAASNDNEAGAYCEMTPSQKHAAPVPALVQNRSYKSPPGEHERSQRLCSYSERGLPFSSSCKSAYASVNDNKRDKCKSTCTADSSVAAAYALILRLAPERYLVYVALIVALQVH